MSDLAVAVIVGRLTRDAEIKYIPSGTAISHFSVATNQRKKQGDQWVDEPAYWEVDLFGKSAESLNQYLTKGKLVAVEGELRQDRWEQDGQQRSKVVIKANSVQLLGSSGGSGQSGIQAGSGGQGANDRGGPRSTPNPAGPSSGAQAIHSRNAGPQGGAPADDFTDDIPF